MIPVYYKGGHPAMSDLAGGHVDYAIMSLALTQQFAQTGRVIPLLISSAKRHPLFPDLPTFREFGWQGDPGEYWIGILSPKISEISKVQQFTTAIDLVLQKGHMKQLESTGMIFDSKSGSLAQQFFQDELNRFQRIRHKVLTQQ
jgi:tripartite-type tricarboxylate transporter receptor subunit TctC